MKFSRIQDFISQVNFFGKNMARTFEEKLHFINAILFFEAFEV